MFRLRGPCSTFLPSYPVWRSRSSGSGCITQSTDSSINSSAIWDFKGRSNEDAISQITSKAPAYQKELRELSFVNQTLAKFDFAKKKAETDAAIASAKGTEPFAKKIAEIDAKLGPICQRVREVSTSGQAMPFALEDEAMKLIAERDKVHWKLKFHVLLND